MPWAFATPLRLARAWAYAGLLAATGCRCTDDPAPSELALPSAVSRRDPSLPHAVVRPICGPAGRRSLALLLAREGSGCGDVTAERYSLRIFGEEPVAPRTHRLGSPQEGTAVHCRSGAGACTPAIGGHVVLDDLVDDKAAVGTFSLTFADGRVVDGSFDAVWCPTLEPACP